jgi:hypothetical protein
VLEAIKQTKVDIMVTLAIYIDDGDWSSYGRQIDAIQDVLKTYGTTNIAGITGRFSCDAPLDYLTLRLTFLPHSWQRGTFIRS